MATRETAQQDKTRRIQLRYRFGQTILSDLLIPGLVLPQDQRVRLSTLSATWIRDTRDKPLDASRGFYQTLDLGITPKALARAPTSHVSWGRVPTISRSARQSGQTELPWAWPRLSATASCQPVKASFPEVKPLFAVFPLTAPGLNARYPRAATPLTRPLA